MASFLQNNREDIETIAWIVMGMATTAVLLLIYVRRDPGDPGPGGDE